MKKVDALSYEMLIRRAFQCGRYGVKGADADIYRRLERAEILYRTEKENKEKGLPKQWNETIEDLAFKYGQKCNEVCNYIGIAINKVLKDYSTKLSDVQKRKLESYAVELSGADLKKIESIIDKSEKEMIRIELYPQ